MLFREILVFRVLILLVSFIMVVFFFWRGMMGIFVSLRFFCGVYLISFFERVKLDSGFVFDWVSGVFDIFGVVWEFLVSFIVCSLFFLLICLFCVVFFIEFFIRIELLVLMEVKLILGRCIFCLVFYKVRKKFLKI